MRKFLSLTLVMALSVGLYAQNKVPTIVGYKKVNAVKKHHSIQPSGAAAVQYPKPERTKEASAMTISKVEMGKSTNPYTLLVSQSTCLTANQDLNMVAFTARTNSSTYAGNRAAMYFSTDGGATFAGSAEPWQMSGGVIARYPSGGIYNPTGNTDPNNAYAVCSGPALIGGGWGGAYWGSVKLDGTNLNEAYTTYSVDTTAQGYQIDFPRVNFHVRGDKFFVMGDDNLDDLTGYTALRGVVNIGQWDAVNNKVNWSHVGIDPGIPTASDGYKAGRGTHNLVMADDATEGWAIFTGRNTDATSPNTMQPIIFKTNDGGQTWAKQVFNWEDMASTALNDYLDEASVAGMPFFGDVMDATVDVNGNLNFISIVWGAYSNNPDSLWYITDVNIWKAWVFNFVETNSGWDAFVVDTIFAEDVDAYPFPDLSADDRFQMSRTPDGSKLFYSWLDTDPSLDTENKFADVWVSMYDVESKTLYEKVNVTKNTELDASCFWLYMSDECWADGDGYYTLHLSVSDNGPSDVDPVTHFYIDGVQLFIAGANTLQLVETKVSVYPNPATDLVNVEISGKTNGGYTISVFNTVGAMVMSQNVNGNNTYTLDVTSLPAGLYMMEVSGSNGKTVRKLIKK